MTFTNLEKYVYSKKSAARKLLDLLDQTRTGVYSDPLFKSALTDWTEFPSTRHEMSTL